jgi:GAF domain-containing protein
MATLPEDVSDDLRLVIDELESAIADIESRLESTRAERDEAKARQVELAIESAGQRRELGLARDRQNASAEILRAIADASGDAEQALQLIAETTENFFGAAGVTIRLGDGDRWIRTVRVGAASRATGAQPAADLATGGRNVPGTVYQENRQIHIPDLDNIDPSMADWPATAARAADIRTICGTPLRRGGKAIGAMLVYRDRLAPFTDDELELQQSFADQAVIAIENARLFNETQESLERQTATADILKVIASSPSDTTPVFAAIATSANRLLGGFSTAVFRFLDGSVHLAAFTPVGPAADSALRADFPKPVDEFEPFQLAQQGKPFPIPDTEEVPFAPIREIARLHGFRSMLFVPLMNGSVPVGIISVTRREPGAFSPNHTQLLQTFADQAVIAVENTRLFNETQEALERQTATADILKVIASSPDDVQPVFDAIAASANRLLGGFSSTVFRFIDGMAHLKAFTPTTPEADDILQSTFPGPVAGFASFQMAQAGEVMQVPDTEAPTYELKEISRARGYRSMLFVPLMNNGMSIGSIAVTRVQPGPFANHHVQLLQTFADQAVIAIENVRLFNETREALERQTATADILKVIASSPDAVQPVFEAIAERSNRLIDGLSTAVYSIVDDTLHLMAFTRSNPEADAALQASFPRPLSDALWGDQTRRGEIVQIPDFEATVEAEVPSLRNMARLRGFRAVLFVPLLRDGTAIGLISVTRREPGAFAAHHVQLLQTFADQAVIAIGNVRLFDEVQAKTADLLESLQQQTATADVLKVISRSAFDLETVMNTLTRSASELYAADMSGLFLREGDFLVARGVSNIDAKLADMVRTTPVPIDDQTYMGRSVLTGEITNLSDVDSEPLNTRFLAFQKAFGYRSLMVVPLLREGRGVGVFALCSVRPEAFSQRQIELVQTFADQAVIAIENVRLFDEVQARTRDLSEALTYQTGSSNILKVIASSPTNVGPVLEAIVESACELCGAYDAVLRLRDGDFLQMGAHHGPIPVNTEKWSINPNWTAGRAALNRKPVHVHDLLSAEGDEFPEARDRALTQGHRTILSIPLMREGESIGVITLRRNEVNPFGDKQISLLQTFADQAVIAIGNVRLFDEVQAKTRDLTEALTYQTGSSNILKVIASSPTDVGPVLKAIVESACELCEAYDALVRLKNGDLLEFSAHHGPIPVSPVSLSINRNWSGGLAVIERKPVHIHDLLSPEGNPFPEAQQRARELGHRTVLTVPLLREGESVGCIIVRRAEVHPFTDKQIALLQTFADQAVIAIGNVRLFDEVQARTRDLSESLQQQTATSEVLEIISASAGELTPVFQKMLENATRVCGAQFGVMNLWDGSKFDMVADYNVPPAFLALRKTLRVTPDATPSFEKIVETHRIIQIEDVRTSPGYLAGAPLAVGIADLAAARTMIVVPMLKEDELLGFIMIYRQEVKPFTEKQVALLENFTKQAVIAIENVRLLNELRQRTDDLTSSLHDLRTAQDRLVQTEKLASLGQLTAGIAHEIKNPLNFVNNFSALSAELTDELNDLLKSADLTDKLREEVDELTGMLKDNLEKVVQHGKRADSIVKNMLLHSREGAGEHRPADINALLDESLNLAYHGARAEKPQFNVTLQRDFDQKAGMIEVFPQEITRVFLNLISNGFYAVTKRRAENGNSGFEPVVSATTRNLGETVEIRIRDNGTGIPEEVREKMFNPFFTTKPAGEGTGLGLSMSHDIIVKQHGGRIEVATEPGQFTEFTIVLPRTSNQSNKNGGQA